MEKEVLNQISEDLKIKFLKMLDCNVNELSENHRLFIERVNDYCIYKTLLSKYSQDENKEVKKA